MSAIDWFVKENPEFKDMATYHRNKAIFKQVLGI
jgi:hypothetical protein